MHDCQTIYYDRLKPDNHVLLTSVQTIHRYRMSGLQMIIAYLIGMLVVCGSVYVTNEDVPSFCLHMEYGYGIIQHGNNGHCHLLEHRDINQKTDQHFVGQNNPYINDKAIENSDRQEIANHISQNRQQFVDDTLDDMVTEEKVIHHDIYRENWNKSESNEKYIFTPNNDSQMQSFRYVCIEYDAELDGNKVVIYRSEREEVVQFPRYDLTFTKRDIPSSHTLISEYPAYFVVFLGTSSFFHHYDDILVDAYYMLRYTGRLQSVLKNQLYFYHNGLYEGFKQFYTHTFLMELPVRPDYFEVYKTEPNICYKDAAFSFGHAWYYDNPFNINIPKQIARQEVTHLLKQKLHLGERCSYMNDIVLLNRRSQRTILNSLELHLTAVENGFTSINIVYFEDLNLLEQAEVASCARIYILVHGAAIIWIPFMPPNSAVIEIAWPQKNWMFYANLMFARVQHLHLFKIHVPNDDLYPDMGNFLKYIPPEKYTKDYFEKQLSERSEDPNIGNPYKFAHCLVNKQLFLEVLKQADDRLRS